MFPRVVLISYGLRNTCDGRILSLLNPGTGTGTRGWAVILSAQPLVLTLFFHYAMSRLGKLPLFKPPPAGYVPFAGRKLAKVLPKRTRPPLLKIYSPWSPYRPYRGKDYQRMNPKNYRRKTLQRGRRDAVWIKRMHEYNDKRDDNDHYNWLNGYRYHYDDDGNFVRDA